MGYRGMGHIGNGVQAAGVQGTCMGNEVHGYGAQGYGVQRYRPRGPWGTGQVMCQNVKICQVVKKMSNVKKSNT